MGRRADDYHVRGDLTPCPSRRTFTWEPGGNAARCHSCGRVYPDHVRREESGSKQCVICMEDHD